MMHTLYAWCVLTLSEVRPGHASFVYVSLTHMAKTKARESSAVVNSCREWACERLMLIGTKVENRAKNSVLRMCP
jgi:predicted  nucleic acid-binding Zn ribbon protein